jgi:hypothetical protein
MREERRRQDRDDAVRIVAEVAGALANHLFLPLDNDEISAIAGNLFEALRLIDEGEGQ